ncbi:MAG: acyl-CoA dehydrogenase family protein [Micromonosporaceae bacterium]
MDFAFDDTQRSIAELAADVLSRAGAPELSRGGAAELGQGGYDEATWKALGEAGLLSLVLPERLGGDGLGVTEAAVVLAEAGRRAAAVPALATLALGVLPIVRYGSAAQQDALLGDPGRVFTAGLREPTDALPTAPRTTARSDGGRWVVDGVKVGVPYAAAAHRILVPATLGDRAVVLLVDPSGPGVTLHRSHSSGDWPEYVLRLDAAPAEQLGEPDAVGGLSRLALAGACAFGDGLLAGMLDLTARHIATREQFGRPLAAFQAVTQQIADVYLAAQTVHLTTWSACWRLGAGLDPDDDLDIAAYWLAAYGPAAAQTCHHLHGGLGLDVTYPLHRYSSYARDLARFVGGGSHRLDRLGDRVEAGACI